MGALLLLAAACADGDVEIGVVDHHGESEEVLVAPSSARVGEAFTVTVNTYGGGCHEAEWMLVETTSDAAELTPYDRVRDGVCTAVLNRLPHEAELAFSTPGEKILRVHGRRVGPQLDAPTSLSHSITIE
jgi:hypothetical protein